MMCALTAGQRGRRVALLEHNDRVGRKIAISGGGRYDRLMEMLGAARPVPAIGFMIRLDLAEASG